MGGNWIDIVLVVILAVTVVLGLIKGSVRSLLGIAAVILGLILASQAYGAAARLVRPVITSALWANLVGFLLVFLAVQLAGWAVGFLISKVLKGPLRFMDHVLGGLVGFAKGVLICGVCVLALVAFPVDRKAVKTSQLAPFCYRVARAAVLLVPDELKAQFKETYFAIKESADSHG
ncbi:MAG: CvpA family protein [Candidatus Aminicenantes bacterium]|nr:CvpA family protein [Candidatus Aminicenantes bacterium]